MNRYLLKFEKQGALRYTSHLDLLRIFKRAFKRVGMELVYSKGFNPHPKISFAQPLSLGYTSKGEYLEIETVIPYNEEFIVGLLNSTLPFGIRIIECREFPASEKSAASSVRFAVYEAIFPSGYTLPTHDQISNYLNQTEIKVYKEIKKKKERKEINIRPLIKELYFIENELESSTLFMKIHTGSISNLNPELLISSLFEISGIALKLPEIHIKRIELYKEDEKGMFDF